MKKTLFFFKSLAFSIIFSSNLNAQDERAICGTDFVHEEMLKNNPHVKASFEAKQNEFKALLKQGKLQSKTNEIIEIPIVIHLLDDGSGKYLPTEQQINDWIDRSNAVFSGTASDVKGPNEGGTALPFKLVLAKRTPDNKSTNGIVVHDFSSNSQYVTNGVNGTGISNNYLNDNLRWDSNSYYNIFITNKINGVNPDNTTSSYTAGYAYFPGSTYDFSVMLYHVVVSYTDTTFTHEMLHALNVPHPFNGGDGDGANCGSEINDGIADTQNIRSGLWFGNTRNTYNQYTTYPTVGVTINDCTNTPFDATLFNIMNYGRNRDRFTAGQGEVSVAAIKFFRKSFSTSLALTAPTNTTSKLPIASCTPQNITQTSALNEGEGYSIGIESIKFGNIDYMNSAHTGPTPKFYNDYTRLIDINPVYGTTLDINDTHDFTIGASSANSIKYVAYLDLNNDGTFSDSEKILDNLILSAGSYSTLKTITAQINIPSGSVLNEPLRLRVIGDFSGVTDFTACGDRSYGEVEDYIVTLTDRTLSTNELDKNSEVSVVASGNEVVVKSTDLIESIHVYDMNGRLVSNVANINKNQTSLRVNVKNAILVVNAKLATGKVVSKKVMIK